MSLSKEERATLQAARDLITLELQEHGTVQVPGLGKFYVKEQKLSRSQLDMAGGGMTKIKVVRFKPSQVLKDAVKFLGRGMPRFTE